MMENLGYYGCGCVNSKALTGRMPTTVSATTDRLASTRDTTLPSVDLYNLPFGKGQKFGNQLQQSR